MKCADFYAVTELEGIIIRGVIMYRKRRDFMTERMILVYTSGYYKGRCIKRWHLKKQWNRLVWKIKGPEIRVRKPEKTKIRLCGEKDIQIFSYEVRALRRKLKTRYKERFDKFYYEK